ncbi:hypothetical protein [Endozoicomonas elysicola]|uniref:Uncharacterized protein n=1 Tax=Endozoicomonas elysicola TaxID=305900 RepID=A0A081KBB5_9GAMM|nr:hypothetical protein [Endozoicomonas elysicola]KEI71441.1 hypothetical protein GV64_12435 [Endozoicomonas elysicola]
MKTSHKVILFFLIAVVFINAIYFAFGGKSRLPVEVLYLLGMNVIYFVFTPVFWVGYSSFAERGKRTALKVYTWLMGGVVLVVTLILLFVETGFGDWLKYVLSES